MKKVILISSLVASLAFAQSIDFKEAKSNPDRVAPSENDVILSFHSSIKDVKKSVVNISSSKNVSQNNPMQDMFNDPFFKEFFGFNFNMPKKRKSSSLGSGVIISKDGYIVTNNHVVENADEILVSLPDNDKEFKAKVIGLDPKTDLAVIKIDEKNLNAVYFGDSSNLTEGDIVFAIGNPFGVGSSVTQGIISALNKSNIGINQYENFIQTDASINPGNSGGALVDSRGALIGINSAILSRSGGNNGIGFAIPSNMVKKVAKSLIEDGKIDRGYIGVMIGNLTNDQKELYKNKEGALISMVEKDMPADKAGLQRGDLVIKINNKEIKNANDLKNLIGSMSPGEKIKVEYERQGKIKSTTIKLSQMQSNFSQKAQDSDDYIDGLSLQNLTDELKYRYRLPRDLNGVLVNNVKPDSKADKFGFTKGDVIIQIAQKIIKNLDDFKDAIKDNKGKKTLVWVNRGGIPQGLVIK